MLTQEQVEFYHENGYLKVDQLFTPAETKELASEMVRIINNWGQETIGWPGPWRTRYLEEEDQQTTKAVFMHNPHFYSAAWGRVIFHERLTGAVQSLIGDTIQWHHTVLHAKPPKKEHRSRCTRTIPSIHTMDLISLIASSILTMHPLRVVPCGLSPEAIRRDPGNTSQVKGQHRICRLINSTRISLTPSRFQRWQEMSFSSVIVLSTGLRSIERISGGKPFGSDTTSLICVPSDAIRKSLTTTLWRVGSS